MLQRVRLLRGYSLRSYIRYCKGDHKTGLPFNLSSDHKIHLRKEYLEGDTDTDVDDIDACLIDPSDLDDMEIGNFDPPTNRGVNEGEENEEENEEFDSDYDPDDKSHPVEDTGFELRKYPQKPSEGPEIMDFGDTSMPNENDIVKLPETKKKKKYPYIQRDFSKCRGCGIRLQSELPLALGYVPPTDIKKSRKKKRICQRCFYLRYHNKEPPQIEKNVQLKYQTGLSAEEVSGYLSEILPTKSCVVLHMVDLNDVSPSSFIPNITKVIGTNPILFIGTKLDLLPHGWKLQRLKLWLQKFAKLHCGLNQLPLTHVHIVSARSGQNTKATMRNIDMFRNGRDLYCIGPVNCGKSSFINSALLHVGIGGVKYDKKYGLTTSNLPGTTLDAISMPLKSGGFLHDTPGFQVDNLLPSLTFKERKALITKKIVRPKIVYMREGKSIVLGGTGRLDYLRGPPLYFAIFTSCMLDVHYSNPEAAERLFRTKLGTFLQPPILLSPEEFAKEMGIADSYTKKLYSYLERDGKRSQDVTDKSQSSDEEGYETKTEQFSEDEIAEVDQHTNDHLANDIPKEEYDEEPSNLIEQLNEQRPVPLPLGLSEDIFEFTCGGEDYENAFVDFVFPGIGWISVTGKSQEDLLFKASSFSKPYIRDPIMPLEANRENRKAKRYTKHGKLGGYKYSEDQYYKKE